MNIVKPLSFFMGNDGESFGAEFEDFEFVARYCIRDGVSGYRYVFDKDNELFVPFKHGSLSVKDDKFTENQLTVIRAVDWTMLALKHRLIKTNFSGKFAETVDPNKFISAGLKLICGITDMNLSPEGLLIRSNFNQAYDAVPYFDGEYIQETIYQEPGDTKKILYTSMMYIAHNQNISYQGKYPIMLQVVVQNWELGRHQTIYLFADEIDSRDACEKLILEHVKKYY